MENRRIVGLVGKLNSQQPKNDKDVECKEASKNQDKSNFETKFNCERTSYNDEYYFLSSQGDSRWSYL